MLLSRFEWVFQSWNVTMQHRHLEFKKKIKKEVKEMCVISLEVLNWQFSTRISIEINALILEYLVE